MNRIFRTSNILLSILCGLLGLLAINIHVPLSVADSDLPPPAEMTAVVSTPIAETVPITQPLPVGEPPSTWTWQGLTDQGEPITIHVDGESIILLRVGLRVFSEDCSSHYTSVHSGFLGYVSDHQFRVVVDTEQEFLVVEGSLGGESGGHHHLLQRRYPPCLWGHGEYPVVHPLAIASACPTLRPHQVKLPTIAASDPPAHAHLNSDPAARPDRAQLGWGA
ncbi:MAG: hypothetical protein HC884_10025 [Chloroflexaceae bacterium]|nr:hypothetical protein [Chloroflexaceae bacterium]